MKLVFFAAFIAPTLLVAETRTITVIPDIAETSLGQPYKEYFQIFTQAFAAKLREYSRKITVPYDVKVILTLKKEKEGVVIHINGLGNFKQPDKEFIRPFLGMRIAEPVILARAEVNGVIAADLVKKALMRDALKGVPKKLAVGAKRHPFSFIISKSVNLPPKTI